LVRSDDRRVVWRTWTGLEYGGTARSTYWTVQYSPDGQEKRWLLGFVPEWPRERKYWYGVLVLDRLDRLARDWPETDHRCTPTLLPLPFR
jgi:hypothetical protein